MAKPDASPGFWSEFKQFIARGNVMDMAVGVIIGGAFKTIADSLTQDILMPFVGIFIGKDSFANLSFQLGGATFAFGNFVQAVINFLIMALVIFCLIKGINKFHRKKEIPSPPPPAPPEPSPEERLLAEIRDLLKEQER